MSTDDASFLLGFVVALPLGCLLTFLWCWAPAKRPAITEQYDPEN